MPPSVLIHVRVPPDEIHAWDEAARRLTDDNISELIRLSVRRVLREQRLLPQAHPRFAAPGFRMG